MMHNHPAKTTLLPTLLASSVLLLLPGTSAAATVPWSIKIVAVAPSTANDLHFTWTSQPGSFAANAFEIVQVPEAGTETEFSNSSSSGPTLEFNSPQHVFFQNPKLFQAGDTLTIAFNVLSDDAFTPTLTQAYWTLTAGGTTQNLGGGFQFGPFQMVQVTGDEMLDNVFFQAGRWQENFPELMPPTAVPVPPALLLFPGVLLGLGSLLKSGRTRLAGKTRAGQG